MECAYITEAEGVLPFDSCALKRYCNRCFVGFAMGKESHIYRRCVLPRQSMYEAEYVAVSDMRRVTKRRGYLDRGLDVRTLALLLGDHESTDGTPKTSCS